MDSLIMVDTYTCNTCGVVFTEASGLDVETSESDDASYIKSGACPGCGGRGVIVEEVDNDEA